MKIGMFKEFPWSRGQTESETFDLSFDRTRENVPLLEEGDPAK